MPQTPKSSESVNNLLLLDLLNRLVRDDIKHVLEQIQSIKQNAPNLEVYKMKKKLLMENLNDHEVNLTLNKSYFIQKINSINLSPIEYFH